MSFHHFQREKWEGGGLLLRQIAAHLEGQDTHFHLPRLMTLQFHQWLSERGLFFPITVQVCNFSQWNLILMRG